MSFRFTRNTIGLPDHVFLKQGKMDHQRFYSSIGVINHLHKKWMESNVSGTVIPPERQFWNSPRKKPLLNLYALPDFRRTIFTNIMNLSAGDFVDFNINSSRVMITPSWEVNVLQQKPVCDFFKEHGKHSGVVRSVHPPKLAVSLFSGDPWGWQKMHDLIRLERHCREQWISWSGMESAERESMADVCLALGTIYDPQIMRDAFDALEGFDGMFSRMVQLSMNQKFSRYGSMLDFSSVRDFYEGMISMAKDGLKEGSDGLDHDDIANEIARFSEGLRAFNKDASQRCIYEQSISNWCAMLRAIVCKIYQPVLESQWQREYHLHCWKKFFLFGKEEDSLFSSDAKEALLAKLESIEGIAKRHAELAQTSSAEDDDVAATKQEPGLLDDAYALILPESQSVSEFKEALASVEKSFTSADLGSMEITEKAEKTMQWLFDNKEHLDNEHSEKYIRHLNKRQKEDAELIGKSPKTLATVLDEARQAPLAQREPAPPPKPNLQPKQDPIDLCEHALYTQNAVPRGVVNAILVQWLLKDQIDYACEFSYQMRLLGQPEEYLPYQLFKAVMYGMHTWSRESALGKPLAELVEMQDDNLSKWHQQDGGKCAPLLVLAAAFQPVAFAGKESAALHHLHTARDQLHLASIDRLVEFLTQYVYQGLKLNIADLSRAKLPSVKNGQAADVLDGMDALLCDVQEMQRSIEEAKSGYQPVLEWGAKTLLGTRGLWQSGNVIREYQGSVKDMDFLRDFVRKYHKTKLRNLVSVPRVDESHRQAFYSSRKGIGVMHLQQSG
ncbi:MAG: hypothetical protein ACYYK0_05590 [Candidatus Eutrophobiaceae bacterium]